MQYVISSANLKSSELKYKHYIAKDYIQQPNEHN